MSYIYIYNSNNSASKTCVDIWGCSLAPTMTYVVTSQWGCYDFIRSSLPKYINIKISVDFTGLIVCWSALTVAEPHWTGRFHFPMLLTQIAWLTSAKNATNSRMETDKLTIGPVTLDTTDPYPPNHMLSPFLKLAWTSQISPNILKHQPRTSHMTIVYIYMCVCTLAP